MRFLVSEIENAGGETFKSDNITVTAYRKPHCEVKFDIAIQPKAIKACYATAVKNIRKEISVPGFRKGKVPEEWILEKYKSSIDNECMDIAINSAVQEAIQLSLMHPIKDSFKRPKLHNFKPDEEAKFSIEFEIHPAVPSVRAADIVLKKIEKDPVTPEMVQEQLDYLQKQMATYEPIENRGIKSGDYARVNIEMLSPQQKEVATDQQIHIDGKDIPEWVVKSIMGLKAGESAESTNPDQPDSTFKTTVLEVQKGILPELNDDFAKLCKAESLDDLKEKIKNQLQAVSEEENNRAMIRQLEERILDKYPFDIPLSFLQRDTDARLEDYVARIRQDGASDEWIKENLSNIRVEIEKVSAKAIRLLLLMHHTCHENKLALSDDEYRNEEREQMMKSIRGQGSINWKGDEKERHEQITSAAMNRKVRQYLLDHVTIE